MPRAVSKKVETDILKLIPPPKTPPKRSSIRIGIHTSTAGGVENAAERAYRLGCSCLQVFSSSPRQWKPMELGRSQCEIMSSLRAKYDLSPLVIHANYLINVAGGNPEFHQKSIEAFRAEVQRGIDLCADYLVLHPGSFRGATREEGLSRAAEAIEAAVDGLGIEKTNLKITIENTAGSEFSLGGSFEQVAELMERLRKHVPVAACIDTCHTHVAGYDITTKKGFEKTMQHLDATVGLKNVAVFHCNDAKAACGSKLDRHQHIGKGTIGLEPFKWLLNDPRLKHAVFIAETPVDEPLDDLKNINALKGCVDGAPLEPGEVVEVASSAVKSRVSKSNERKSDRTPCDPKMVATFDYSKLSSEFTGLAKPAQRALINAKLYTPRDLAKRSLDEVTTLHGIGSTAVPILKAVLKKKGLKFRSTISKLSP